MELCDLDIHTLHSKLVSKEITPIDILDSVSKRIREREKDLNSFITIDLELATHMAKESMKRFEKNKGLSMLDGIPMGIKDNMVTKGIRTSCGSKILEHYIPPYSATVVERVLKAGAVLVGKTNMDEFAMGSSTENSAFGPTKNPHALEYAPGGSSGGSAAAVAAGEVVCAIGSDTGGSIRQPASFCGVVGMKPTYGRVSRYGLVAFASSLDQIGPITKTVDDCALLLGIMAGHDPKDSTCSSLPVPDYTGFLKRSIKGKKIGIPMEYTVEGIDPDVLKIFGEATERLRSEGAQIEEISLPHTQYAIAAYYIIATAEASSNLARYDGVKYGLRMEDADLLGMYEATRSQGFGREVKRRIMLGTYVLSSGYYDAYYLRASKVRTLIKRDFELAFQEVDVILAPVSPVPPFKLGERIKDPLSMYLVDAYTTPTNLSGLPAISIPCGRIGRLPVGIQFIGRPFDEGGLIWVADAFEETLGGR